MYFFFKIRNCNTILENHADGSFDERVVMSAYLDNDTDIIKLGNESVICTLKRYQKDYGHSSSVRHIDESKISLTIREYDKKRIPKKMQDNTVGFVEYGELYFWIDLYYERKKFDQLINKIENNIEIQNVVVGLNSSSKNISNNTLLLNKSTKDNFILLDNVSFIFSNFFKKE